MNIYTIHRWRWNLVDDYGKTCFNYFCYKIDKLFSVKRAPIQQRDEMRLKEATAIYTYIYIEKGSKRQTSDI